MSPARSAAKPTPQSKKTVREDSRAPDPKTARSRKREALERFVDKNAKILAELAK